MAENLFTSFKISGEGMSVQRMRLSATAKNIANVNTTKDANGLPYQREVVIVRATEGNPFEEQLHEQITLSKTSMSHGSNINQITGLDNNQFLEAESAKDSSAPKLVYDPSHPDADKEGYVKMPNINIVTEMVEMISAQRAFEANAAVVESVKNMARDSLEI